MKTETTPPKDADLIVVPVYDFRARRFADKVFRTELGALAAMSRANRIRRDNGLREHSIWWRNGKPEEVTL